MESARGYPARAPGKGRRGVPRSASEARHLVEDLVHDQLPTLSAADRAGEAVSDMLLVTSELVTNAIRHGGGITGFWAVLDADGLRLAVRDRSDTVPFVRRRDPTDPVPIGGYGWPLICRLASEVTVTPCPGGGKEICVAVPAP